MDRITNKLHSQNRRKNRVRSIVSGSAKRPRMNVYVSNRHVTAQLIDDTRHQTLAYVSTVGQKNIKGSMLERAAWVGAEIGKKAKTAKVKHIAFDRGGRLYHGRVKALADAARAEGLEF